MRNTTLWRAGGLFIWFLVLLLFVAAWIWIEREIFGSWPPSVTIHHLHLLRGVVISILTSFVAILIVLALKRQEAKKITIISSAFVYSTDAMLLTDLRGIITDVNSAFTRLFGYERTEAIGKTTRILRSKYSTDEFYKHMWSSIETKHEWKGEITNRAKDGSEIPVWLSITPIMYQNKKIGYMGIEIDMREKKELERRAIEAERMAAVGRMSSQVAHEVRNPLSSISLNVELLRDEITAMSKEFPSARLKEADSYLKAIEREVDRLAELAGDYLKFSRLPQQKKEKTNLSELLSTIIGFLREEARRRHIDLCYMGKKSLADFSVDPRQIEQAVINLIKNAFDAMPSGGVVEVGADLENKHAVIYVKDHGTGINEEVQRRLFEPFFTTKEKGTGLGLSLVRQVVSEHGGRVSCESVPGKGSTFFIRIPTEGAIT